MSKIVIIGPAYPYRWGIAHHTNQLAETFIKAGNRVSIFTFFRQYPRFFYPGKHQTEPAWTPNPLSELPNLSVYQLIDTINPISWYRTARAIIRQNPDFCLIKYWHPYFVPCFAFIAWILGRRNVPVICIIDNLFPHERHFWDTILTRLFFTQITVAITQSEIVHNQFRDYFSYIPETMILHPVYDQFGPPVWQKEAQKILQIPPDKIVLLFFWFIRPYKWLDTLLSIMPQLIIKHPNIHLIIAGECFGSFNIYQKIIDDLNLSKYITLHLKYVPNNNIPNYFGACDLLVMPYRTITNSGIENIARVYASKYLLTVWDEWDFLVKKITDKLMFFSQWMNEPSLSWATYSKNLFHFLKSQNI